jgi:hypothetical protein
MKSLTAFLQVLLLELGERCGVSTIRDCKTIAERFEHEGQSFLTITLPSFGADLQKGLDQGYVDHDLFQGFSWTGGLPRLLGGFLDLVFDRKTGRLLDTPDVNAISAMRQITLMFAKMELQCSPARVEAAFTGYLKCEQDLRSSDREFTGSAYEQFTRIGAMLWSELLTSVDQKVYDGEIIPKHGSGSTADGLRGNSKYNQTQWTSRLEEYFPHGEFLFSSWSHFGDTEIEFLEPGSEIPVKVITVPKTLKSPRIIAEEPTCMMYAQQGLFEVIQEAYRSFTTSRSFICSDSQEPNRLLARKGSITGTLATLDLSEASDRVSNQHVRALLRNHPHLSAAVDACRSRKADVDGHGVIRLAKFASMGSALCFPFEAMVFCTMVFVGIERELKRQLTKEDVKSFFGRVRVYGDDIIVPVEYTLSVVSTLHSYGMKVNERKSFWTGRFRESCGGDYYAGHDVSIVKLKHDFPQAMDHVDSIVSTVAFRNNLFARGYTATVDWLDAVIRDVLPVFPIVEPGSRGLGRWSSEPFVAEKMCPDLQVPLVKAAVVGHVIPTDRLDGHGALLKYFLKRGVEPFQDKKHLQRAGRPQSSHIKLRWVSPVTPVGDGTLTVTGR